MQPTSFSSPEKLALGKEKVMGFIDCNPSIEAHRFEMEKLFHMNEHVLDSTKEQLLSYYQPLGETSSDLYDLLSTSDRSNDYVRLNDGRKVQVTQGNWRSLICDATDPSERKKIFNAIFKYYEKNKNTLAKIYQVSHQMDLANVKARKFNSILESHLFRNNIPTSVYETLVEVASNNNKSVKKYYQLRKESESQRYLRNES